MTENEAREAWGDPLNTGTVPVMTLRDYFAAVAMSGMATYQIPPTWNVAQIMQFTEHQPGIFAAQAYKFADAMLAERAK